MIDISWNEIFFQQQAFNLSELETPLFTTLRMEGFSIAAMTLSLSLIYLLTECS